MGQTASHKNAFKTSSPGGPHSVTTIHSGMMSPQGTANDYIYQEDQVEDDDALPTIMSSNDGSENYISSMSTFARLDANKKIPVVFKYTTKSAKEVYLIGTFTSWKDKVLMIKSDGDFVTIVDLPEGEHQYKFVVDGKWEHDPNQSTVDDTFNGKNNIVIVKKSDFEVMDALAMDSIQQGTQKTSQSTDDLSRSPPGEYTDEIPVRGLNSLVADKPPYLPPQLLNIVLNKDTSVKCEPALLPEPNHVMLKHLYALSIRDGVMVLSSTLRFKQKFITTCFYKPI